MSRNRKCLCDNEGEVLQMISRSPSNEDDNTVNLKSSRRTAPDPSQPTSSFPTTDNKTQHLPQKVAVSEDKKTSYASPADLGAIPASPQLASEQFPSRSSAQARIPWPARD